MRASLHSGSSKHPDEPFKCPPPLITIKSHWSIFAKNCALSSFTRGSLSPCMRENLLQEEIIFSKLNAPSRKLSNLLLLFFVEGEETSMAHATFFIMVASR